MPYERDPRQLDDSDHVCSEHVNDNYLAKLVDEFIGDDAEAGDECAFCSNPGMPVDLLVEVIVRAVDKFFDRANDAGVPFADGDWVLPVQSTDEVLADLGIDGDSPLASVAEATLEDDAWVPVGDPWPDEESLLDSGWQAFSEHVKHRSRFLFETTETDDNFGMVETLGTRDFLRDLLDAILGRQPRLSLTSAHKVFRARVFVERDDWPKTARDYASPTSDRATQGRMNPAGIAFFYGALDVETAAIEVYDGSPFAAVATFQPTRLLRLVDLTDATIPSPFDESVSLKEHRQTMFLKRFTREIARPIVRDGRIHQEYVPSQAVTEYIRFQTRPPLDGIAFSSARTRGTNVVIFAEQEQCLGPSDAAILRPTSDIALVDYGPPKVESRTTKKLTS